MIRVLLERIAGGGDAVGRLPDGRTVFVPRGAPQDDAEVEVLEEKPRFARGRLRAVVRASPARADPPCPHYVRDRCGGCQLQHLSYPAQLEAKRRIVGDALRRIGGRQLEDPPITAAPEPLRYRTRITLAVSRGPAGDLLVGLHPQGEPGRVFQLEDCLITDPSLMALWGRLRAQFPLLPRDLESLVLRLDRDRQAHLIVTSGASPWAVEPLAAALADPAVVIWWRPAGGPARVLAGADSPFPALAFEQVNPSLGWEIRRAAVASLGDLAGRTAWDLYGGVGDTARLMAAAGARVFSVDLDRSAIEWAEQQPSAGIRYFAGRVEEVLHRLPPPDVVILNPPRTGAHPALTGRLEAWAGPGRRACYVSCDPATLARDLKRMPSLAVTALSAWDLFPQTAHVETLAVLESR